MGLALNVGLGSLALVVEGVEVLLQTRAGGDAGIDGAEEPRLQFCAIVITPHCSLQRSLRKSRLRFLELRKSKSKPLGIAPFLPGRSRSRSSGRIWAASRNGARRRPHSASSATWFSAISRR